MKQPSFSLHESIYSVTVSTTMTHPYKGTIIKLGFKECIHNLSFFGIFIHCITFATASCFLLAFLHNSEMRSSKANL